MVDDVYMMDIIYIKEDRSQSHSYFVPQESWLDFISVEIIRERQVK